jgi:hypothetical protein
MKEIIISIIMVFKVKAFVKFVKINEKNIMIMLMFKTNTSKYSSKILIKVKPYLNLGYFEIKNRIIQ